jgi:hypothetical protein
MRITQKHPQRQFDVLQKRSGRLTARIDRAERSGDWKLLDNLYQRKTALLRQLGQLFILENVNPEGTR